MMKKTIIAITLGLWMVGVSVYAAGDLQVNGEMSVGTTVDPDRKLNIYGNDLTFGLYLNDTTGSTSKSIRGGFFSSTFAATSGGTDSVYGFLNYLYYTGSGSVTNYAGMNQILYKSTQGGTTTFTGTQRLLGAAAWMHETNNQNYVFNAGIEGIHISLDGGGTGTINGTQATGLYVQNIGMDLNTNVAIWLEPQTHADINNYGIVLDGDGAGSDIVFGPNQEARIYSEGGYLKAQDIRGNVTTFSPHDPVTGEWIFYSKNIKTGKTVRVNMEKLVKAVERLTGEKFMIETTEEVE
jgi:hypothetical protein